MSSAEFFLGVHGGATYSFAMLVDAEQELGRYEGKGLNHHNVGVDGFKENLSDLLSMPIAQASGRKLYVALGLAGLDTEADQRTYDKLIASVLPPDTRFVALNDAKSGLEAKCYGHGDRILVISGTGSTVCGENLEGDWATAIGWDYALGDEGSGYRFGDAVVRAAMMSWDGRREKTILMNLVLERVGKESMEDFIKVVYSTLASEKSPKPYIASFAPLLDKAIAAGDLVALQIRENGANELAAGVKAVAKRLKISAFHLGLEGSVWKMPGLIEMVMSRVREAFPNVTLSESQQEGVEGAVLLAKGLKEE